MGSRPESQGPPEIYYDHKEARKYTSSSRNVSIQTKLSERALELLRLPDDGVPRLLVDIGCGSGFSGETLTEGGHHWVGLDISQPMLDVALEREVEGDLLLGDMGQYIFEFYARFIPQGLPIRSGVFDGAISVSAVQWLCNADKSSHEPKLRLKAFFGSLYRCLARGASAVFQVYPENIPQRELILSSAMHAGFSGGMVVDYPHSKRLSLPAMFLQNELGKLVRGIKVSNVKLRFTSLVKLIFFYSAKMRKEYLFLTCGPPSISTTIPLGKGNDEECCLDNDNGEVEDGMVFVSDRHRPRKRGKVNQEGTWREWVLNKKEKMREKGNIVPPDTKYTGRKRKAWF
ncbi:hypothetical protein Tsubulata_012817 [Turnera subulata]|uniref:Methyltransferase type 11 domain-containing protein n=1 Tax=Turnera subulata TaxID=218843 RepID=A0A9Q0FGX4_9ROSI|nr:hypothetical protein Tsubulata_012817 [Turnera subulata]